MNPVSIPRIRSVRMKDGGATVTVLRSKAAAEAHRIACQLQSVCADAIADHGDEFAGWTVITWDQKGRLYSALRPGGPVGLGILPLYVHDAALQHVAVILAQAGAGTELP